MAQEGFKRRLTAILSADVKDYTRLMREDEESTIRTLTAYRTSMTNLIQQYRGRVVDATGDNLLAEFMSAVDAVNCSVEIQKEFARRNAELGAERKMEFRIGVNLSDVVEEGERIYGDGVNIAARIESIADAGGICISNNVYEQVKNKLDLDYGFLGEQIVKNIPDPVRVYQINLQHKTMPAGNLIWRKLSNKPSVAVLPFVNMSDDPKQEYFSDGIAEDLMTDLSKISELLVISRNSTFAYKGKFIDTKEMAEKLGARYILEGSVRKVGDQVRINAQLIDATKGHHLWADRYDGKIDNIFDLQDRITQKIVSALAVKLTEEEQEGLMSRETSTIAAYDEFLKGMDCLSRTSANEPARALTHFGKALEIDPNYGRAYAGLARAYENAHTFGIWERLGTSVQEIPLLMHHHLNLAMKNPTSIAHRIYGMKLAHERHFDEAITELEQAIALDPNDARSNWMMSGVLSRGGRPREGIDYAKRALRIDPGCVY